MLAVDGEQSIARNIARDSSTAEMMSHFSKILPKNCRPAFLRIETHMKILGAMTFLDFENYQT
jgi:hypothetical protein